MLNVYVQREPDETGKGKFLRRLAAASVPLGVNYTWNPKGCHALLDVGWWHGTKKDIPRVLRMDGAEEHNWRLMKNSVSTADAVIWQTNYCKEYCLTNYEMVGKKEYVINNGADPEAYKDPLNLFDGKNVLISGKWKKIVKDYGGKRPTYIERKNKRLKEMIALASDCVSRYQDICFWIAGETDLEIPKHERIHYLGGVPDDILSRYIAGSDIMLNLACRDWCPNSVVECLVGGKPIIYCPDGGGIVELVGESGYLLSDYKAECVYMCAKENRKVSRPDLFISSIAEKYKKVFEEIVK